MRAFRSSPLAIEPTERALWVLTAVGGVGVVSAGLTSLDVIAPAALSLFAIFAGADFVLARSPSSVRVRRALPERIIEGDETEVALHLEADRPVEVLVTDTRPGAATPRVLSARCAVAAGAETVVRLPLRIDDLGVHRFGRVALRTLGPFGLLRRRGRVELDDGARVNPNLARIAARAERLVRGQDEEGARRKRSRDEGRDFESLREYVRGDDVRLIDWKATARRGHHIVKRLQPETRQEVMLLLDAGRQLSGRHEAGDGGRPRFDHAVESALTLAAAALSRKDRVGLFVFAGEPIAYVAPDAGRAQLRRIADAAMTSPALPEEADYAEAVRFLLAKQKRRAMMVLVTDVVDEPSARSVGYAVASLRGRHLPLVLALKDPGLSHLAERMGETDVDDAPFLNLAVSRMLEHRRRGIAAVKAAGARVVDAPGNGAEAAIVRAYLGAKSAGRL